MKLPKDPKFTSFQENDLEYWQQTAKSRWRLLCTDGTNCALADLMDCKEQIAKMNTLQAEQDEGFRRFSSNAKRRRPGASAF